MRDLFEQKIRIKNIRDVSHFRDYSGPDNDYDAGENDEFDALSVKIEITHVVCYNSNGAKVFSLK